MSVNARAVRLAWDTKGVGPFESSWSIFIRLIALNFIGSTDIYKILQYDPKLPREISDDDFFFYFGIKRVSPPRPWSSSHTVGFQHWSSDWIDFDKFSRSINVSDRVLKTAFLDKMGIGAHRHDIRHCSECIKFNHHNTFFNWDIISHCPWHNIELEICKICSNTLRSAKDEKYLKALALQNVIDGKNVFSLPCGHMKLDLYKSTTFYQGGKQLDDAILQSGADITSWISRIKGAHEISRSVRQILNADTSSLPLREREAGLWAAFCAAGPPPFKTKLLLVEHNSMRWTDESEEKLKFADNDPSRKNFMPLFQTYRMIRRHIYRRFVRRHRACYRRLISLDRDECQCIQGEKLCLVSIAFMIWRMSMEDVIDISKFGKHSPFGNLRIITSDEYKPFGSAKDISIRSAAHFWLGDFFGIWAELDRSGLNPRIFVDNAWSNFGRLIGDLAYFTDVVPDSGFPWTYEWGSFHELVCRSVLYLSYISDKRCNTRSHLGDLFNGGKGSAYYLGLNEDYELSPKP